MAILNWINSLLEKVAASVATFFAGYTYGRQKEKTDEAEKERDAAQKNADAMANRPRNLTDRLKRLRMWRNEFKD